MDIGERLLMQMQIEELEAQGETAKARELVRKLWDDARRRHTEQQET